MRLLRSISILCLLAILTVLLPGCDASSKSQPVTVGDDSAPPSDETSDDVLRAKLDHALDASYYRRQLDTQTNAAWQVLHGVLAFGRDALVMHQSQSVKTVDWLSAGGNLQGWKVVPHAKGLESVMDEGSKAGEGHPDQWLAVLSQCDLPRNHPITTRGRTFTLEDMVRYSQWNLFEGKECSWSLIALSVYLTPDARWTARDDSQWSLERIVAMEADHALGEGACGGSHRLIGMAMALNRYREQQPDAELTGGWLAAHEVIEDALVAAQENQQANGEFSTDYFQRPARSNNLNNRIGATGHTLELLAIALPENRLREPWVVRSADLLCSLLKSVEHLDVDCGPLYHAVHGLALYRQRLYGTKTYTARSSG
jgi:hypothetical protein